jgi:hypothetical protein
VNVFKFRLPMLRLSPRTKGVLGVLALGLTGWVMAQNGYYREPAARLRAPQPIKDPSLVTRGLAPEYSSFGQVPPPTGKVSAPTPTKKPETNSNSWVFGPSGPPPSYMFGSSSKTNPISTAQPKAEESSSMIGSAWSNVKNFVTGTPTQPATPRPTNPGTNPAMTYGAPAPQQAQAQVNPNDNGVYARQPAYRWYGWGTTTPGTNPYAPNGQSPQGSSNWYVQTGATPGAFPEPVTPATLEFPDRPRYAGNPIFGPEVTAAPTIWMNAPVREVMAPPPTTIVQPVFMMPAPVVVNAPAPQPAVPTQTSPVPAMPTAPRVDVVPGLMPHQKPNREPIPTISNPPREVPAVEAAPKAESPIVHRSIVNELPPQTIWSTANRTSSDGVRFGAAPVPAVQAPVRSQPIQTQPANAMPPMPNFGPSLPVGPSQPAGPTVPQSAPATTSWNSARPMETRPAPSPVASKLPPPPASIEFRPSTKQMQPPAEPTTSVTSFPVNPGTITPASWKESKPLPVPGMPVPERTTPTPQLTLEQQIRNASFNWAKIQEVRTINSSEMVISFTATNESDARAAAEAISKLGSLRAYTVSFNARIVPK